MSGEERQIEVKLGGPDAIVKLSERLENDVPTVLEIVGNLLVAQAQNAFVDQSLGGIPWEERSPKQPEPFINIIPVIRHANEGIEPRADDFQRRPALGGAQSPLARSVSYELRGKDSVEAGNPEEWSGLFQYGGVGRTPITDEARETLFNWLYGGRGRRSAPSGSGGEAAPDKKAVLANANKKKGIPRVETAGTLAEYQPKLARILWQNEIVSSPYPRPWLGMTDKVWNEMQDAIGRLANGELEPRVAA